MQNLRSKKACVIRQQVFLWVIQIKVNKKTIWTLTVSTYVKTSLPQPAIAVKRRGPRSLAGLTAYPELKPIDSPITRTTNPTVKASRPGGIAWLYGSTMARMQTMSAAVPIICWREKQADMMSWKSLLYHSYFFFFSQCVILLLWKGYLIKEAVNDGEMFPRVGSKDTSCGLRSSHIETSRMVPQGILKVTTTKKLVSTNEWTCFCDCVKNKTASMGFQKLYFFTCGSLP